MDLTKLVNDAIAQIPDYRSRLVFLPKELGEIVQGFVENYLEFERSIFNLTRMRKTDDVKCLARLLTQSSHPAVRAWVKQSLKLRERYRTVYWQLSVENLGHGELSAENLAGVIAWGFPSHCQRPACFYQLEGTCTCGSPIVDA